MAATISSHGRRLLHIHARSWRAVRGTTSRLRRQPSNPTQTCSVVPDTGEGTVTIAAITNVRSLAARATSRSAATSPTWWALASCCRTMAAMTCASMRAAPLRSGHAVPSNATYDVTIVTQPAGPAQECTIAPGTGSGTVTNAHVTTIQLNCVTTQFSIGGTVTGLHGSGLQLQNNGGEVLSIAADGPFKFPTSLPNGAPYSVIVVTPPNTPTQSCLRHEQRRFRQRRRCDDDPGECVDRRCSGAYSPSTWPRRAHPALQRTGDCAGLALRVGGFACEEQRVLHRRSERLASSRAAGNDVAVRAKRERIRLPVVQVGAFEHRANSDLPAEHGLKTVERSAGQLRIVAPEEALRVRAAGPGADQRAAQRDRRPERSEGRAGRTEEQRRHDSDRRRSLPRTACENASRP